MLRRHIISLGGSLVRPASGIDTNFIKKFSVFIGSQAKKGNYFLIVVGGGSLAREYVDNTSKIKRLKSEEKDWLGIHATRLNAYLIKLALREIAYPDIIVDERVNLGEINDKVIVASGFKPGFSTDGVAVLLAEKLGEDKVINLSNIDYIYDKDPKKNKNAIRIRDIRWRDFKRIVGSSWQPSSHLPFDPIASKMAYKADIAVVVANGHKLKNLGRIIEGKTFSGTLIS